MIALAEYGVALVEAFALQTAAQTSAMLLAPGSTYSLAGLAITLAVAVALVLGRRRRSRAVPARVLVRALFPRRIWRSASSRADMGFSVFNILVAPVIFAWAILTSGQIAALTAHLLGADGAAAAGALPWFVATPVVTVVLYLSYEFGYWLHHYLSHKVPVLWPFHRVHHTADSLSLITAFRVHPVDTIVFYNIVALVTGITAGVLQVAFGDTGTLSIGGNNILVFTASVLLTHLHHSHLPIRFSGRAGWWLLSPGHHQIHHSDDPAYYDQNFGNSLAIWDRLFGTLHDPAEGRQRLSFGAGELGHDPHSVSGGLLSPFADAARAVDVRPLGAQVGDPAAS